MRIYIKYHNVEDFEQPQLRKWAITKSFSIKYRYHKYEMKQLMILLDMD
jgi:hypothetical protein